MKKLNILFSSFPDFSSNAKPLYSYMKKRYGEKMNFSWVVRTEKMYYSLKDLGIDVYMLHSDSYREYLKNVDVIFSTHGDIIDDKPKGALYIELWHGISSKNLGFLSSSMSDFDLVWYEKMRKRVDYFIVPSDFWRIIFSTRFNVNYGRTLSLGYPKLDYFKDNKCCFKLEKVLGCSVKSYSKIIYYMPTYRNGCNRQDSVRKDTGIFNVCSYDENALISFLETNNYLLCVKKHPSEQTSFLFENDNIKIITDDNLYSNLISINEILDASDLLITDYSSVGIEYIFLNKPVVYLIDDLEEYEKKRGITFMNLDFWMPGYRVKTFDELLSSISNSFDDKYPFYSDALEKKRLWFGNLRNGGCKKICDFLFHDDSISHKVKYYVDNEEKLEENIAELNAEMFNLNNSIANLSEDLEKKNNALNMIINSKGWKILEYVRRVKRKFFRK